MAAATPIQIVSLFLVVLMSMERVISQGHMSVPPMRSSMWRYGFLTPINYDDNQLWCGSEKTQHDDVNKGRCGQCGDTWSDPSPRPNDEGGLYGTGIIVANYTQEDVIDVQIQITTNHGGFLEFRLCADKTSADELTTDECLDKNLLEFEDGSTRYILGISDGQPTTVNLKVRLPAGVSCQYCVLQMWWKTNINNNGCIGCGDQEEYKNCADIAIASNEDSTTTTIESTVSIPTTPPDTEPNSSTSSSELPTTTVEPELPTIPIDSPSNTTETYSTSTETITHDLPTTTSDASALSTASTTVSTEGSSTGETSSAVTNNNTSTEQPTTTVAPQSPNNTTLYIVAGVLGALLLLVLIIGLIFLLVKAKKNRKRDSQILILPAMSENSSTSQQPEKVYGLLRTKLYGY